MQHSGESCHRILCWPMPLESMEVIVVDILQSTLPCSSEIFLYVFGRREGRRYLKSSQISSTFYFHAKRVYEEKKGVCVCVGGGGCGQVGLEGFKGGGCDHISRQVVPVSCDVGEEEEIPVFSSEVGHRTEK